MLFNLPALSETVRTILQKHAGAVLPLTRSPENQNEDDAQRLRAASASSLFPGARQPEAALSGLFLLLNCWEASHHLSQNIGSREGSYWHAIAHRMEPDSWNAGYWFRKVGKHPIFPELHAQAQRILDEKTARSLEAHGRLKPGWDPFLFIEWCDEARAKPGTPGEEAAEAIQRAEWQLLFEWCAASEPE